MVLEISNCDNCYKIIGSLTQKNLSIFQNTFRGIFNTTANLTINIEGLNDIDREGVSAITKLHNEAITLQKKLTIIGLGNKELYQHFKSNDAA
jgi:ABC-type transporter Mla MlaB component